MSKLFGFSILAVSTWLIPGVQAETISYSATLGCDNTCVTTFVEWSNFDPGVAFVVIENNFGDPLFTLSTDLPPESTGQIDPDPQTITGLSPADFTNAQLVVEDVNGNVLDVVAFTASSVPEPGTWGLTVLSFGLLLAYNMARRRKLQTALAAVRHGDVSIRDISLIPE